MTIHNENLLWLILIVLGTIGVHHLVVRAPDAGATVRAIGTKLRWNAMKTLANWVLFAGFYSIALAFFVAVLSVLAVPFLAMALLIIFPGSVIAWLLARTATK